LALVRHFVELHGGTVAASSQGVGRGSSFHISVPIVDRRQTDAAETPGVDRPAEARS
jgi:signal transduction histidine kinase